MAICTAYRSATRDAAGWQPSEPQPDRIRAALGVHGCRWPQVDEETLSKYYRYLSASLAFPFVAHYPEPTDPQEEQDFRCVVLELLDPEECLGDEFDGIFCRTRKGKYEINLPLTELVLPEGSPNWRLVEDYSHWFWNWR
jgi:hypothetical protein